MTQTDRVLSNISAIITLLENFPMGFFDGKGKTYNSAFEFIMDVLRACGITDQVIIDYIIGKIYGFEGQPGYTVNGLYELIKTDKLTVNPQNKFISGLEYSIKAILMALFTSIFTCSALPILPNRVFDKDTLVDLMSGTIQGITEENPGNDHDFKMKIPVHVIDIMNMLSISPVSSYGSLYYLTDGSDKFFRKTRLTRREKVWQEKHLMPGDEYTTTAYTYSNEITLQFDYIGDDTIQGKTFQVWDFSISEPVDFDIEIYVKVNVPEDDKIYDYRMVIKSGNTSSGPTSLLQVKANGNTIEDITINGFRGSGEVMNPDETKSWLYLSRDLGNGLTVWENLGGIITDDVVFETSREDEISNVTVTATEECDVDALVDVEYDVLTYVGCQRGEAGNDYVRYNYLPDESDITEDSPDYIVYYDGQNPNLLYRTYDMNAFIWYVLNRSNNSTQEEENHMMWDSRVSASKKGYVRSSEAWNAWYASKDVEGAEFEYCGEEYDSEILYPIVQIEPYSDRSSLLLRIPAQRYFLPKKRNEIYDGTYDQSLNKTYFNASVYRFDWEYLQNIQILNPRLLLARFIEHLMGVAIAAASTTSMDIVRKEIEGKLSSAIKTIIMADDMEVEDCYKMFSNEDFDNLLNEMMLQKYKASEYNGETTRARVHNTDEYAGMLDAINSNATTVGNISKIQRSVNQMMLDPGTEFATEYNFEAKFDSNVLKRLVWAVVMPIIESLFTPQVMLLMMVNFELLGITNMDEALGQDFTKIINLLINKIIGLAKSIIKFIKDKIIEMLIDLFKEKVLPLLRDYMLMLYLEHITNWLVILLSAVKCLPLLLPNFRRREIGYIEEVDYADIVQPESVPESQNEC